VIEKKALEDSNIAILISNPVDRDLLSNFILEFGGKCIAVQGNVFDESKLKSVDAIVCDSLYAYKWVEELIALKSKSEVFFPVVVLVPPKSRSAVKLIEIGFDDVFTMPIPKKLLLARLKHLLRLREQSRKLSRKSELLFQNLVEQSVVGMALIREGGKFYFLNGTFAKMVGQSVDIIMEEYNFFDIVCEFERERLKEIVSKLCHLELPYYNGKVKCINRTGREFTCEFFARCIDYSGEKMIFLVALDVTEREELEEKLIISEKMAVLGKLAGGIAHDFNNLLTVILGNSELLLTSPELNDRSIADVDEIRKAAEKGASLTEKLLILSRRKLPRKEDVNINDIVSGMKGILTRTMGEDVELVLELDKDVGIVRTDPANIEQIILNIAVNAREAMPDGGRFIIRTRNVTVSAEEIKYKQSAEKVGNYSVIIFEDSGKGMDRDTLSKVFDPFFTTKENGKGTGLGMSIVYSIVQDTGGWIDVFSEPGKGTIFSVFLPQSKAKKSEEILLNVEEKQVVDLRGRGERILLVEDEDAVRKYINDILGKNGYVVTEASRSEEALEIFEKESYDFDIVISDVVLPDFNGLELVEKMKERKRSLKAILISGYSDERSRWEAIIKRGYKFIQKPFHLRELLSAIKELMVRETV